MLRSLFSQPARAVAPPAAPPAAVPAAPAAAAPRAGIHDVFVGRQPIFDHQERLYSYELLYRAGAGSARADGVSLDQMCRDTVLHTLLSIGLAPLTGGTLAFVNLTRQFLMARLYELFDPKTVVVELLETVEPDDEVVAECERLVSMGYTLALDDFVNAPGYEPLLRLAKVVKIDVLNKSEAELRRAVAELKPYGVRVLAERVETAEVRDQCRALGYTLFQGYFYSRPQVVSHRELGVEQVAVVRLMNLLGDPSVADAAIENAFKGDPSLSYKLLRIANSAAMGARGVSSIGHALRMVGRQPLHRWLTLLFVSSSASQSAVARELAVQALARGRLAELVAERSGRRAEAGAMFLTGLFSLLDALLRMPMAGVLAPMHIAAEVKAALLSRSGPYAAVLALVEAQEHGDWAAVDDAAAAVGVAPALVSKAYTESLAWAAERLAGD
jgi:EAL and modified HD-GYP domain-containing signal transduction protein